MEQERVWPEKEAYVRAVFSQIDTVYDRANLVMTGGLVRLWQRRLVALAGLQSGDTVLDVGCGTGEISLRLARQVGPQGQVMAVDLCAAMLAVARRKRQRQPAAPILFQVGDGLALPYATASFDAVTSGFLLRNVTDVTAAWREMTRVVRPGGRVACLELSRPARRFGAGVVDLYFHYVIPQLGRFLRCNQPVAGGPAPYAWLRDSRHGFPCGPEMLAVMKDAGLRSPTYYPQSGGVTGIYVGIKGDPSVKNG